MAGAAVGSGGAAVELRWALLATAEPYLQQRLAPVFAQADLELAVGTVEGADSARPGAPEVVVLALDGEDDLLSLIGCKQRWPQALAVCVASQPVPDLWRRAQRRGAVVVNRGAVVLVLRERLASLATRSERRFPLCDAADAAGRLGLVARMDETPLGSVALYRVEGTFCAVADRCPHAGAVLSDAPLEDGVVTCPGHGSQFDVRTGERLRGPADVDLGCWRVEEQGGQLWVCWE